MNGRRNPLPLFLAGLVALILTGILMHMNHLFFFADQPKIQTSAQSNQPIIQRTTQPNIQPTLDPSPTIASPTSTADSDGFQSYQKVGSHESATCKEVQVATDNIDLHKQIGGGTMCQREAIGDGIQISVNIAKNACAVIIGTNMYLQYPNGGGTGYGPQYVAEFACNTSYTDGYMIYTTLTQGQIYMSSHEKAWNELQSVRAKYNISIGNTNIESSVQSDCSQYDPQFVCSPLPPNHP